MKGNIGSHGIESSLFRLLLDFQAFRLPSHFDFIIRVSGLLGSFKSINLYTLYQVEIIVCIFEFAVGIELL
jgi:hypothetical protein